MTNFVIASLAVWEAVEIWQHSALMAPLRARVDCWQGWVGQLLHCPFCLSPWVALVVVLTFEAQAILAPYVPRPAAEWILVPVYALAVARAANVCNDLMHKFTRTPKYDKLPSEVNVHESETSINVNGIQK